MFFFMFAGLSGNIAFIITLVAVMIDHLNGMSLDLIWVVLCFQLKINVLELEGIGYVFIIMS